MGFEEGFFYIFIIAIAGYWVRKWWIASDKEERWGALKKGLAIVFILGGARVYFNLQNDETASASASLVLATLGLA